MPNKQKNVLFDELCPYFLEKHENGETEHSCNLTPLFRQIESSPLRYTTKEIYGDKYRFHTCKYDKALKVWELQVLHLREKVMPGIADAESEFELIKLADNQYPAESTTALYDEQRCTLHLQRNLYGISIHNMQMYLIQLLPKDTQLLLKPKLKGNQLSKIVPSNLYRKVILAADTEQFNEDNKGTSLFKTLNTFNKYQGKVVTVTIGFGHSNGFLKADMTSKLIHEAYNFTGTQKLVVQTSDPDDFNFETLNLLDDRKTYNISFEYSRQNPITHDRLYYGCKAEFKQEYGIKE